MAVDYSNNLHYGLKVDIAVDSIIDFLELHLIDDAHLSEVVLGMDILGLEALHGSLNGSF